MSVSSLDGNFRIHTERCRSSRDAVRPGDRHDLAGNISIAHEVPRVGSDAVGRRALIFIRDSEGKDRCQMVVHGSQPIAPRRDPVAHGERLIAPLSISIGKLLPLAIPATYKSTEVDDDAAGLKS
jgi:hypothetical protein